MYHLPFILLLIIAVLSPHMFVEYKVQVNFLTVGQSLSEIIFENVTSVYNNGTFVYNLTVYVLNYSIIQGSALVYDNISCPTSFFYIPHVGKSVVERSIPLTLVSSYNGTYVYFGKSFIGYVEIDYYYYVNSSGVPFKIEIVQIGENGKPVSNTTYTLISSNIVDPNAQPILPKGFKLAEGIEVSLSSDLNQGLNSSIGSYFIPVTFLLAIIIVGVRLYEKKI